jgi:RNA polymerase sigma-70 factor (ECF subfamily)
LENILLQEEGGEKELLQQVAGGDERAFSKLVAQYSTLVYRYLLYWLKEPQLVEETAQDIFIRVWTNRQKLPEIGNFRGYLYVITRNKANTELNRLLSGIKMSGSDIPEEKLFRPHQHLELKELSAIIDKAIEALPPRRKEVFKLSREAGLTYDAIAERLQISRGTVKDHMVAALLFLRSYISEHAHIVISLLGWIVIALAF